MVNHKFAISGKANSGKNTLTKMIYEALAKEENKKLTTKTIAFADPIKEMISIMYPNLPKEWLYGASDLRSNVIKGEFKDGDPLTVRQILIDLGRQGRLYNKDHWVNLFKIRYNESRSNDLIFCPDVRFVNEMEYLKSESFFTIRLLRDKSLNIDDISEIEQDSIPSNSFKAIINNNGTLSDLKHKVELLVKTHLL